jgi:hypothetical protein
MPRPEPDPPETTVHIKEPAKMTDRIAEKDIIEKNALGQTVVLVHAGQRIPEGIDVPAESEAKKPPRSRSKKAD